MRVLIVIPARGGSTRVPRKNLQVVGGITLLERAVNEARCAGPFVVSTDDAKTYDYCVRRAWETIAREHHGDGPMVDVLLEARKYNADAEAVLCCQPTSPLRDGRDIRDAMQKFRLMKPRSLVSVNADTGQRNGAIYITRVEMLRDGLVFDDDSLKYPMPAARSLDINSPEDLEEARRILG